MFNPYSLNRIYQVKATRLVEEAKLHLENMAEESPGGGGHCSLEERMWNIPKTEIRKNKKKFNRAMKVGNDIKRDNKGMYAMDI